MEFDKSRVYTALNADELQVGSKVIIADSLANLYDDVKVGKCIRTLKRVLPESVKDRFEIILLNDDEFNSWNLAYLVSEPNAIRCADLKIGDVVSDGISELMVLGVDRANDEIFLPRLEWVSDADLTGYHKKVDDDL